MIVQLTGNLLRKQTDSLVVDVQGVGYEVFVPTTMLHDLPSTPEQVTVYIYHHIREDTQLLFGFPSQEDRDFFILVTSVSGVGPKVGLKILSTLTPQQFVTAILQDNLPTLTSVPGVGKKVAERLVVELKDKVPQHLATDGNATDNIQVHIKEQTDKDDIFQALKGLGYSSDEVKKAYHRAARDMAADCGVEEGIKTLLKHL